MRPPPPRARAGRILVWSVFGLATVVAFAIVRLGWRDTAAVNYGGAKKRTAEARPGLAIMIERGTDSLMLEPGMPAQPGDVLRFLTRGTHAWYLSLRARDGGPAAPARRLFPVEGRDAISVSPGTPLPIRHVVVPGQGRIIFEAVFADHAFAADGAPPADAQVVQIPVGSLR